MTSDTTPDATPAATPATTPDTTPNSTPDTTEALLARAQSVGVPLGDLPETAEPNRLVRIDGTLNFRQLGGIAVQGGTVRRGVLFRSDQLSDVTDAGLAQLQQLGLRNVFDFRLPVERNRQPSRLPEGVPVTHVATGDSGVAEDMVSRIPNMLMGLEPIAPGSWWDDNYVDMLDRATPMFTAVVEGIGSGNGVPALFHCTGGKDRTGLAAMLILQTLGASEADIIDDFLATNLYRTPGRLPYWETHFVPAGITHEQALPILGVTRSGIVAALEEIKRRGGAEQYFRDAGVSADVLSGLRRNLVV